MSYQEKVFQRMCELEGTMTVTEACKLVAKEFGISEFDVRVVWRNYQGEQK